MASSSKAPGQARCAVPPQVLERLVRAHLGERTVRVTAAQSSALEHDGNAGNDLCRVQVTWESGRGPGAAAWVLKRWMPDALTATGMDVGEAVEVLAWECGLLSDRLLPRGLAAPIAAATHEDRGRGGWIAMHDVSAELAAYKHPPSPEVALERTRFGLDRLARLHAGWEQPERAALLARQNWLLPQERRLRCGARVHKHWLHGDPLPYATWYTNGIIQYLIAAAQAVMDWLPERQRALWQHHLHDRAPLIRAAADLPQTLLHGDLDRRNVALREAPGQRTLLLIDWEWIGTGTPALDIAWLLTSLPGTEGVFDAFEHPLAAEYHARYRAYGGHTDAETWQRAWALAVIYYNFSTCPSTSAARCATGPTSCHGSGMSSSACRRR